MTKTVKSPTPVTVSLPALRAPVNAVVTAYKKAESASAAIKTAVIKAADIVQQDQIGVFVSMLTEALRGVLSDASIRVEATRVKKVLTALIAGDISPDDAASLRGLYALTKKPHGNQAPKTVPTEDSGNAESASAAPKKAPEISRQEAIRVIFGHFDGTLETAIMYAVKAESAFVRWASASAAAAQAAEIEKAAASLEKVLKPKAQKAPAKRRKAA